MSAMASLGLVMLKWGMYDVFKTHSRTQLQLESCISHLWVE